MESETKTKEQIWHFGKGPLLTLEDMWSLRFTKSSYSKPILITRGQQGEKCTKTEREYSLCNYICNHNKYIFKFILYIGQWNPRNSKFLLVIFKEYERPLSCKRLENKVDINEINT